MADRSRFSAFMTSVGFGALASAKAVDPATGEEQVLDAAQLETTVTAALTDGETAGFKAGMAAQSERYAAVLGTEKAQANLDFALHMLATTENTADQINGSLGKLKDAPVGADASGGGAVGGKEKTMTAAERIAAETGKTDVKPNDKPAGEGVDADDRAKQIDASIARHAAKQPGNYSVGAVRR